MSQFKYTDHPHRRTSQRRGRIYEEDFAQHLDSDLDSDFDEYYQEDDYSEDYEGPGEISHIFGQLVINMRPMKFEDDEAWTESTHGRSDLKVPYKGLK